MVDKFIMAGGTALHIADSEQGEHTIVLIHGYLESMMVWEEFVPLLYKSARVITLDLPGHGISVVEGDTHSMAFLANTIAAALKSLSIDKCTLVGHSMGGYVAAEFANLHPEMLEGLIFLHSTPNADSAEKAESRLREIELVKAGKKELLAKVAPAAGFAAQNRARLQDSILDLMEQVYITEDEGVIAILRGMMQRQDHNETLRKMEGVRQLFIFGRGDEYISAEVAESLATAHPQARVVWLENSGHMGFIEEPELTAQAILSTALATE